MKIVKSYTLKRINKKLIEVSFIMTDDTSYSISVGGEYDLRNSSHCYLVMLDGIHALNEKGFNIMK